MQKLTHISKYVLIALCLVPTGLSQAPELHKVLGAPAMKSVISRVNPEYPPMAKQLKLEGDAQLDVVVDESGSVEKVTVVSGNPILTKAAEDAVRKWKFTPFTADGKTVKALAPVTVSFRR